MSAQNGGAVDVWSGDFRALCAEFRIAWREIPPAEVEKSEAHAADFLIALLRHNWWLRWRFPRSLSQGAEGSFAVWMARNGERKFGLSVAALKKIRGVFRRSPGQRIYEVYLQDRGLHELYEWALVPPGQRYFLDWLTTHGRSDQQIQDHEIIWFLHESAEDPARTLALTYLVQPSWQRHFPAALTPAGWSHFRHWVEAQHPGYQFGRAVRKVPPLLPLEEQRYLAVASKYGGSVPPYPVRGANILSHFCYPSGIQQAAVWTKVALERAGVRTSCRDVSAGINTKMLPRAPWLGLEVYPFTIITVAPTPYFASAYERSSLFGRPGVYRIAYWAWELETIPEEWLQLLPLLDEIWSPTEFVAQAMRTRMTVPIEIMPPGVEVGPVERVLKDSLGIPDGHCVFLFMFDMYSDFERKNPLAVIRAFRRAFRRDEKATLVLKTSRGTPDEAALTRLQAVAAENGVLLVCELLSRAKAYGFLEMCDCYVSLHRSEGFGLGMAEAMLLGKPVIATGYSGNVDFMNNGNSLLVDYRLTEIRRAGPLYEAGSVWAEPSEEQAGAFMRQVFDDRAGAAALGARAKVELQEKLSLEAAGKRMAARLREITLARQG